MTDTTQKIADDMQNWRSLPAWQVDQLHNRLRALSARASAGEGGWVYGVSSPATGCKPYIAPADSTIRFYIEDQFGDAVARHEYLKALVAELNTAAPQPAQAGASGGMTFAFMAEVCDAAVQAMQANGLIKRTIRLQEVRDQLRQLAAAPQPQEVQRPSADWYRRKIMQGDGVEAMAGPLPPFHVCSNPSARHRHGADPMGHCPDCVAQGLGNWSCTPESPTPPAHGDGEVARLADALSESVRMYNEGRTTMKSVAQDAADVARSLRNFITRPTPEAQEARDADMFWDYDDNERCYDSIIELASSRYDDSDASDGDVIRIQRAAKLPDIWVRLKLTAETMNHDSELDYEVIDAALALPAQGEGSNG